MKKALLLILFITVLPAVASAESLHIAFAVNSNYSKPSDNGTISNDSGTMSLRYIASSGIGIGFTNVDYSETYSQSSTYRNDQRNIKFRALELSYTLRYLTLGFGSPISGTMVIEQNTGSTNSATSGDISYKVSGSTAFATLALKIYDKGSLLLGYHLSSLKFTSPSDSETGTLSNIMLGFRIPI